MSIKAREHVKQLSFSPVWYIGILLVVVYIMFFFEKTVALLPENFQQPFRYAVYVITLIVFIYLLIYTSLYYTMMLSHKNLQIERYFLFFHWGAAMVMVKDFIEIVPEKKYTGQARPKNCTIHKLDGFAKYVLTYREKGEIRAVKIQCHRNFYDEVVDLIELNQRIADNAAKKKKKK